MLCVNSQTHYFTPYAVYKINIGVGKHCKIAIKRVAIHFGMFSGQCSLPLLTLVLQLRKNHCKTLCTALSAIFEHVCGLCMPNLT